MSTAGIERYPMNLEAGGQPRGTDLLQEAYGHDPEALSINAACSLISSLRGADVALQTGRDIHILGQPSLDLAHDILQKMPAPESQMGYRVLFEYFARTSGTAAPQATAALAEYTRTIRWHKENFSLLQVSGRQAVIDNLRPMTKHLIATSESFLDEHLESGTRLPYEGGSPSLIHTDLLRDICDPYYLQPPAETYTHHQNPRGFGHQTRIKLIQQATVLGMITPTDIPLQ